MSRKQHFAIGVDCEGVACAVGSPGGSLNDSRNLEFAKLQASREANAAAQGLFDAGAERVIVWDNHNGSLNLDYDLLDERCEIGLGLGFEHRWPGLDDSFAGVLFVGFHAMENTADAVMAHSFSSGTYQWIKANGVEVGELAIDAAMAGLHGAAPLFVSSDDKGVAEARRFFPGVETVTTKQSLGWSGAVSKHPQRAIAEIREGARRSVERLGEAEPFAFDSPLELEIRYKRMDAAEKASRGYGRGERIDPFTVRYQLNCISEFW